MHFRLAPLLVTLASLAAAAEQPIPMPTFSGDGFIAVTAMGGGDAVRNQPSTSVDENRWWAEFDGEGMAAVDARWTDHLGARLALWLDYGYWPQARDAHLWISDGDQWTLTGGRMIRPIGVTSPDPRDRWRVRESGIGYVVGNDVTGGSLRWQPRGSRFAATASIVNGFFSYRYDQQNATAYSRERNSLGYGVQLDWQPSTPVAIGLTAAMDKDAYIYEGQGFGIQNARGVASSQGLVYAPYYLIGPPGRSYDKGGDATWVSADAKVGITTDVTLVLELARFGISDRRSNNVVVAESDYERWQQCGGIRWDMSGTPFPVTLAGMIQHIQGGSQDYQGNAWEYTLAALTRPWPRLPLHVDAEISYDRVRADDTVYGGGNASGMHAAVRALVSF